MSLINPLSANPQKMIKHTQTTRRKMRHFRWYIQEYLISRIDHTKKLYKCSLFML